MAPRLFAQSFPDPGSMKDFSDAMVETPNTAMVIQPGPPNSGAGGNGPPEDPQTPSQSDDHNPIGVSGAFEGLITTGCGYNVLNHSATRVLEDIPPIAGSVGKYKLRLRRYYVSRGFGLFGGLGPGWRHEYSWSLDYEHGKVEYPNGNVWEDSCHDPLGVSDWLDPIDARTYEFRLADGGKVVFTQIVVGNTISYRPTAIVEPYGQVTTISYDPDYSLFIQRVTEPGGRYLLFTYDSDQGGARLIRVDAYDGQGTPGNQIDSVSYTYSSELPRYSPSPSPAPRRVRCLADVGYSDNTHAYYNYTEDNVPEDWDHGSRKLFPLVKTLQDPRYNGAMHRLAYVYQPGGPHGAILQENYWDGDPAHKDSGPMVSSISPTPPPPNVPQPNFETQFTETRGDSPHRTFTYTPLHITRCFGDQCTNPCPEWHVDPINNPAPQQFLKEYTDFNDNHTRLGYDLNSYINSVADVNNHTTSYRRGPPPPDGIGEIKTVTYPDGSHVDYGYEDGGHYLSTITEYTPANQARSQTVHYRYSDTHKIYQTDYKDGNGTLLARETFTYNPFGQVLTHQLRNGAYESFAYDNRGLLIDKYNPKATVPGGSDPHTHYTYYTSGPWTDRVMTMIGPAPNWPWSQPASETYEYDKKSGGTPCAGRGLVTKMTHADTTFQSFQYDQYGNKVNESNELGERTEYVYDHYNRVTRVIRYMYGYNNEQDEITTFDYSPVEHDTTLCYRHTTNSAYFVTAPTGIETSNVYDENFRKISSTVAGRTTWFHYDPVGNLDCATDPRGSGPCLSPLNHWDFTTRTEYDARNRKWHVWDAQDHQTTFTYDSASNVTRIDRPDSNWDEKTYDALNRVLTDTVPFSTNPTVNLTTWFTYNPSGTLWKVTDARGSGPGDPNYTTRFEYNAADQKTNMTYPDGSYQAWDYDDAHNMKTRRTVGGGTWAFAYDNRNRQWGTMWQDTSGEWIFFVYDAASRARRALNGRWDQNGNPTTTSDVHREYDHAGRLTLDRQDIDGENGLGPLEAHYEYNLALRGTDGKPTHMYVGPGPGYDYDFTYDEMGRFGEIFVHSSGSASFQYSYDNASNETQRHNQANGVDEFYNPDPLNRATTVDLHYNGGSARESYAYYAIGRLQTVTRGNKQDQFDYYLDGELKEVRYDVNAVQGLDPSAAADDLTKEKTMDDFLAKPDGMGPSLGGGQRTVTYFYDKAGNRQSVTDNGTTWGYTPNSINQYTSLQGGTITNGPQHEVSSFQRPNDAQLVNYTYMKDRQLIRVVSGANTYDLAYDAFGRCVKRTLLTQATMGPDSSPRPTPTPRPSPTPAPRPSPPPPSPTPPPGFAQVTKYYIYDGERPILEYDGNGELAGYNLYGKGVDEILLRNDPTLTQEPRTFYYQQDHEGSVTHLTDKNGNVIEKYRYDVFGAPTILDPDGVTVRTASIVSNRFLFTGREYNALFGFYEYRARAYHPGLGRFMSEDPKLFDAGDYNLFRYCHNDPIDNVDPMGTQTDTQQNEPWFMHAQQAREIDLTNAERISLWQKSMETSLGGEQASLTLQAVGQALGQKSKLESANPEASQLRPLSPWFPRTTKEFILLGNMIEHGNTMDTSPAIDPISLLTGTFAARTALGVAEVTVATRAMWVGKDGLEAAKASGASLMRPSQAALKAMRAGDMSLMQAESAAWARGATGRVPVFFGNGPGRTFLNHEFPELLKNMNSGKVTGVDIDF
jgi:RHS repeat-associated protein